MDETSECCRESPRLPLTSISSEDFQFTDEELTDAGLSGTGECVLVVCIFTLHTTTPIIDASRSVTQTIDLTKKYPRLLGCELFRFFLHL